MRISTSIVIQKLLSEQIGQLEADIAAYQTTFRDAPRAAEIIAHISQERDELLAVKEDFCTLPCGMLDTAHILTYGASTNDIRKACAKMRGHRQDPFEYTYQVVSRRGIRCTGQWKAPAELLLHHLGESVRVTTHGVYSLAGEKICDC